MIMISVSSSNIASIGSEDGTMHIRFHSGGLCAYFDVPQSLELMGASSKGKYFHAHIKGRYGDTRIG